MVFLFELYEKYTADLFSKAKPKKTKKYSLKSFIISIPLKIKKSEEIIISSPKYKCLTIEP
jgi:hypothetical protein